MSLVPGGKKTAINKDGVQRIQSVFPDGSECIEDFDIKTQLCIMRKWRRVSKLGRLTDWEVEIGEEAPRQGALQGSQQGPQRAEIVAGLYVAGGTPQVVRQDVDEFFVFRITNMPWEESNYIVHVEENDIVLRTANRKYFKRLHISDLDRLGIPHVEQFLRLRHQNNTLLVFYKKPPQVMVAEKRAREERLASVGKEGDVQCPAQ